jgi:hypothetical protein
VDKAEQPLPAGLVLDALLQSRTALEGWAEWTSLGPTIEIATPEGPVWIRLTSQEHRSEAPLTPDSERVCVNGTMSLEHPNHLLFLLGLIDDPLQPFVSGTDLDVLSALSVLLHPVLPGAWTWAGALAEGGRETDFRARLALATSATGPFVATDTRLCGPRRSWTAMLEQGAWRCGSPLTPVCVAAPLFAGSIRLPREDLRSLAPGDLLCPDLAEFESSNQCEARFGGRRYGCSVASHDDSKRAVVRSFGPIGSMGSPGAVEDRPSVERSPERGSGDVLDVGMRFGSVEVSLPDLLGEVVSSDRAADLALPYVYLEWRGRTFAVAEMVRSAEGLLLEVIRVKRAA